MNTLHSHVHCNQYHTYYDIVLLSECRGVNFFDMQKRTGVTTAARSIIEHPASMSALWMFNLLDASMFPNSKIVM